MNKPSHLTLFNTLINILPPNLEISLTLANEALKTTFKIINNNPHDKTKHK